MRRCAAFRCWRGVSGLLWSLRWRMERLRAWMRGLRRWMERLCRRVERLCRRVERLRRRMERLRWRMEYRRRRMGVGCAGPSRRPFLASDRLRHPAVGR